MQFFKLAAVAAFAGCAIAAPSTSHVVHEKRDVLSTAWVKRDAVPGHKKMPMRIGMRQSNLDIGPDLLMEVSRHDSPKYGKYYSAEEVNDLFAPHDDTVSALRGWLESAGIPAADISQSANKQWLQFDAHVSAVEQLLKTKYHIFEHAVSGKTHVACDDYSVPGHIQEHIDYITPGVMLQTGPNLPAQSFDEDELKAKRAELEAVQKRALDKRTFGVTNGKAGGKLPPLKAPLPDPLSELLDLGLDALCNVAITPPCIRALYNFSIGTTAEPGNQLGIFEDLGDVYSQTDLNEFFATLFPQIPQGTHPKLEAVDGAEAPNPVTSAGPESDLDFQISYPIIYPQSSILFQTDDPVYENNYTFDGFLNNFLYAIDGSYCTDGSLSPLDPPYPDPSNEPGAYKGKLECGVYKPTNVISISYGGSESDLPVHYQRRQCNEYMKLGMQGVSLVLASGDYGVGGPNDTCLGAANNIFSPDFPATCPYITTLGATYLPPTGDVFTDGEVATTRFASGGGFSNIYAIPSYQASAVHTYLTDHTPPYKSYMTTNDQAIGANGGVYNAGGRGYPDFSAIGDNVIIFNEGMPTLIGGTSAAAPTFASILTRINEERLAAGKSTIGFVNPVLYAHPTVLHDITVGDNPNCGTNGFNVTTGWDPVTGLGTPDFPKMLALFMSLS